MSEKRKKYRDVLLEAYELDEELVDAEESKDEASHQA
jgi:hypothetical protein